MCHWDKLRQKIYPKVLNILEYEKYIYNFFLNQFLVPLTALYISSFPAIGCDYTVLPDTPHT